MNTYNEDLPLSAIYESEETPSVEPIPEYVPTQWVDDLEPDIDADHLNHIEDGIKRATDGVNNLIENGGGSFTPSDGYVFVEQEESEEDIPPVPEPMLDADALGGMPVTFFAPQNQIGDAFSEGRDYAAGDYCIRLNTLHKFTAPKPSGPWDASKVVACTVMEEVGELNAHLPINLTIESEVITVSKVNAITDTNHDSTWVPILASYSDEHNFSHHFYRHASGRWGLYATVAQTYTVNFYKIT